MGLDQNNQKSIQFNDLLILIDQTDDALRSAQDDSIDNAQRLGFARTALHRLKENIERMIPYSEQYPELNQIIESGYQQVTVIQSGTFDYQRNLEFQKPIILDVSESSLALAASSDSIAGTILPEIVPALDVPSFLQKNEGVVVSRLHKIDPSLAAAYEQIEQVYYGSNADNVRAAIMGMRQTFDHFFSILAPDDEVRNSPYWQPKNGKGKEKLKIYRQERVKFAIYKHITNPYKAQTLEARINTILDSYEILNSLHTRGRIDQTACRQALFTTKQFIDDFTTNMSD